MGNFNCLSKACPDRRQSGPSNPQPETQDSPPYPQIETPRSESEAQDSPEAETPRFESAAQDSPPCPQIETPRSESEAQDSPEAETPRSESAAEDSPEAETPSSESEAEDSPEAETPRSESETQTSPPCPQTETPRSESAAEDSPEAETPRSESAAEDSPEAETPRSESAAQDSPEAETSRSESEAQDSPPCPQIETPRSESAVQVSPPCLQAEPPDPQDPEAQTSPPHPQAKPLSPNTVPLRPRPFLLSSNNQFLYKPVMCPSPLDSQIELPNLQPCAHQASPFRPDALSLPLDAIRFKLCPFEQSLRHFLLSTDKNYIFKPITLDDNGENAENEFYKIINRTRTNETRILRLYTPLYDGLYHFPPTDTYYIALENLAHGLEPNASVMVIDMTTSLKSFRIIGQQIWNEESQEYRVFEANSFQDNINGDTVVEDLLQFFQHDLCMACQFRKDLQRLYAWFKEHNSRFYFPRSSLLLAYNKLNLTPTDLHIKRHLATPILDFTSCRGTPGVFTVVGMFDFSQAQYLLEPDKALIDQYTVQLGRLLDAVVAAEEEIHKEIRINTCSH